MLALSMTQPSMAQIVTRLNDLIKKLGAGVELTERRELLRQFRQLLDQADKLNAGASSQEEGPTSSRAKT
jgi:DNA-binding transcriptional LysR family regulator